MNPRVHETVAAAATIGRTGLFALSHAWRFSAFIILMRIWPRRAINRALAHVFFIGRSP